MGNEDLGAHYQEIGDLEKAYDAFSRMRQDVMIQKHIVDISRHLISVCIEQGKWVTVQSNVQKIMAAAQPVEEEKALQPYLKISAGLASLAEGRFHDAALSFLNVDPGMGSTYNDTASPNDVAVYGGLCALASMDRDELQRRVLDNSGFRTYLELEPHIRRAVASFVNGRYSACLSTLEGYRNDYLLDLHLQRHVTEIYHLIRSKSIIQYFVPFSCVTLDSMDAAFGSPGMSVEEELVSMIQSGTLVARIDKQNRVSIPANDLCVKC
jgi:COP9 signalosome complex subunit 1